MIAYENCNELCVTLPAGENLKAGMFCKFDDSGKVVEAIGGNMFIGKVKTVRNGLACVMVRGIMEAKSESVMLGRTELLADGDSVLEMMGSGTPVTVLVMDEAAGRCTFLL